MPENDVRPPQEGFPERDVKAGGGRPASRQGGFRLSAWEVVAAAIITVLALISVGALIAVLLSDGSDGTSDQRGADVTILTPRDGETVKSPFDLTVDSPTRLIADPAQGVTDAAHFHAFVDVHPFTPAGEVIPKQEGIYHFSSNRLKLDLPPGEHRIIVVLGDNNEVRIPTATVTSITVTVQ